MDIDVRDNVQDYRVVNRTESECLTFLARQLVQLRTKAGRDVDCPDRVDDAASVRNALPALLGVGIFIAKSVIHALCRADEEEGSSSRPSLPHDRHKKAA